MGGRVTAGNPVTSCYRDSPDGVVHLLHAGVVEVSDLLLELHMPAPLVGRHHAPPVLQVQTVDPVAFIGETGEGNRRDESTASYCVYSCGNP